MGAACAQTRPTHSSALGLVIASVLLDADGRAAGAAATVDDLAAAPGLHAGAKPELAASFDVAGASGVMHVKVLGAVRHAWAGQKYRPGSAVESTREGLEGGWRADSGFGLGVGACLGHNRATGSEPRR